MTDPTFAGLGVSAGVTTALGRRGVTAPFPVQALVLPEAMGGRDLLVRAPTGSGKTLAFGLALVERTAPGGGAPAALVLAPTRELAAQIEAEIATPAAAAGLRVAVCHGGVGLDAQARRAAAADVLVATPGRLRDLLGRGRVSLAGVRTLVLDEADRMLDMGFLPQVAAIVRHLPAERQTMLFSATLDGEVGRLAADLCREPLRLRLEDVATADEEPLSLRLEHRFEACARGERGERLAGLIGAEPGLVLVFCRTRHGAGRLAKRLSAQGVQAGAMHGDLTQGARERALRAFAGGRSRVLVATDVAARGIDLDDVALVVNFDPPDSREAYTHRVGRTARAGRTGRAVTLVEPDQADEVGRIATALGLDEAWAATGYAAPAPKVVYGSRRRGSAFAPGRPPRRGAAAPADAPRRANRVRRGTRARVAPGS